MSKHLSIKYLIIAMCAIALVLVGIATTLRPTQKIDTTKADDDLTISVHLVDTVVDYNGNNYTYKVGANLDRQTRIKNQETVVLNNTEAYEKAKNGESFNEGISTKAILIEMGNSDLQLSHLRISATLNGKGINIKEPSTDNSFEQFIFGLPNEFSTSDVSAIGEPIAESSGQYVFTYEYRKSSGTEQLQGGTFVLNVLTAPYVSMTNEDTAWDYQNLFCFVEGADPTTASVETATRDNENLYFNYNNHAYSSEGKQVSMPLVKYDASKFNLSYTRKIYNSLETITSKMSVVKKDDKTQATITFTSELNGNLENFDYVLDDFENNPFVEIQLEDIGEYEFSMSLLTKVNSTTFATVINKNPSELGVAPIVRKLTVFGYQLKYADNVTQSSELRNVDLGLFSDITTLNYNLMATEGNYLNNINFFKDDEGNIIIPSTNQAPLWFDYIGTLSQISPSNYYYFAKTSTLDLTDLASVTPTKHGTYKKGEYFMESGLYVVELKYTLSSINYVNQTFRQYFAFMILNTAPNAKIINTDDELTVNNDGFTNKNVSVKWDDSNPFNAKVTATYDRYSFDGTLQESNKPITKYGSPTQTEFTSNGRYVVRLYYGKLGTSYTSWTFTIDKTEISGLTIDFNDTLLQNKLDALAYPVVNKPFTLAWNSKPSGATITLEHQQMLIIKDESYSLNNISNLIEVGKDNSGKPLYALKNGYKTSTISSSILKEDATQFDVTQYGLHLFKLVDQAGNEKYYSILLDNTSPAFIFDPNIVNEYNIIKDTTTVVWGASKAISLETPNTSELLEYFISNSLLNSVCDTNIGILNIPFDSKIMRHSNLDSTLNKSSLSITSQAIQVNIDKSNQTITAFASNIDVSSGTLQINNINSITENISTDIEEYFFKIEIADNSTIASKSKNTGLSMTKLEVNLDASQVLAFTNDTAGIDRRLYNGSASNRNCLYLEFYPTRDEFQVEKLTVDFYPFAMDKSIETYPYQKESAQTFDLLTGTEPSLTLGKQKTQLINVTKNSELSDRATIAGKYVVTRVYATTPTMDENDPKRTKTYTFYIDRNDIVEKIIVDTPIKDKNGKDDYTRLVGEYIKLLLGKENTTEFNNLLLSSDTEKVILDTDILPINPIVPENKYSVLNPENELEYTNIESFGLGLKIYFKRITDDSSKYKEVFSVSAFDQYALVNQLLSIDPKSLKNRGVYKFVLNDFTGYSEFVDGILRENVNPNTFTFCIQVTKELPTGKYYGKDNSDGSLHEIIRITSSDGTSDVASTSDSELKFIFEDSVDAYKAKINYTEVMVDRKTKGQDTFKSHIQITFSDIEEFTNQDGVVQIPSSETLKSLEDSFGVREIKKDNLGNQVFDSNNNPIYRYTIVLPTKTASGAYFEGEYKVTIHYYGDEEYYKEIVDNVSYYSNSINVVLDRTAPNFNLLRLVYLDKYLPNVSTDSNVVSKTDIVEYLKNKLETDPVKKERVRQFLRNYAFALPSDFVFYQAVNNSEFPVGKYDDYFYSKHDTNEMYIRKYHKYSNKDEDVEQSYIVSDPEYDQSLVGGVPRFTVSNSIYKRDAQKKYSETHDPFYKTVGTHGGEYGSEGFYEIIEIDQAGNQRIYTVYLKRNDTTITFSDGETTFESGTEDNERSFSLGYEYTISNISGVDYFTTISVYDSTNAKFLLKSFSVTPKTDIEQIKREINTIISSSAGYKVTGARFEITFLNRFGKDITISLQRPGEQLKHTIEQGDLSFKITLPTSTSSTWVTEFIVKQYDENLGRLVELTNDLQKEISKTEFSGVSYTFNAGEYYFYIIDNFGRGRTRPVYFKFGIDDVKDLVFSGKEVNNTTASDVYFTYQTKLYSATLYINNEYINDLENCEFVSVYYNIGSFTKQLTFDAKQMQKNNYKIVLSYNTNGLITGTDDIEFEFSIDTILPVFELTDVNGNNMNYLLNNKDSRTSKEVNISWNDPTNFPVVVTLSRTYNKTTTTFTIEKNYKLYLEGLYELKMTNELGNSIKYVFSISQNSAILYDVYSNGAKIEAGNTALFKLTDTYNDEEFDLNLYMKVFASINPITVISNEKKDIQAKLIYSYTVDGKYKLDIYRIYGTSTLYYEEYIALLQINKNILRINNFLIGNTPDVMYSVDGLSSKFTSNEVYASWDKTFSISVMGFGEILFEEFIKVNVYYNGIFVNEFGTNNLTFSESGEYKLYFSDIAGNNYNFISGQIEENYYTIDILNSVSFKVNDAEPINYAIYNTGINLTPTNISRYKDGTFSMQVIYNGDTFKATDYYNSKTKKYEFNEYGDYTVIMSAIIKDTEDSQIMSIHHFKILSEKEATRYFTFSQLDGYEVVSVIKEGVDITQELKEIQNTTKLMAFEFNSAEQQRGFYEATVKVDNGNLKPVQTFSFKFWINDVDITLLPSIPFGSATTNNITISLNKYAIHQELGNVVIKISGMKDIIIDETTATKNELSQIVLDKNMTYAIQVYTESGTLLQSYVITKNEPLNTVAIVVIVISAIVVAGGIVLFIVFRTRMKVR